MAPDPLEIVLGEQSTAVIALKKDALAVDAGHKAPLQCESLRASRDDGCIVNEAPVAGARQIMRVPVHT
jgi:hypothetical protein